MWKRKNDAKGKCFLAYERERKTEASVMYEKSRYYLSEAVLFFPLGNFAKIF